MVVGKVQRQPDAWRDHRRQPQDIVRRQADDAQTETALPGGAGRQHARVIGAERDVEDAVLPVLDVETALRLEARDPFRIEPPALEREAQERPGTLALRLRRHHPGGGAARLAGELRPLEEHGARAATRQLARERAADQPAADHDDVGGALAARHPAAPPGVSPGT